MKFKVGQKVMLKDNAGMNAIVGSIAIIYNIDKEFLYVMWTTLQRQNNGAYSPFHFEPVIKKNQQLLFSFME